MSRLYSRRGEVASSHAVSTWQSVMFSEFEAQMSSEARPFPCIFGIAGYRQDQLRSPPAHDTNPRHWEKRST
jgi:FPC/CPF motif-containing protein YcgG